MVSDIAIVGSVIVSGLGAIFGLYQARKADRSATTTKTIELGVTTLLDQYQESNKELRDEVKSLSQQVKEQHVEIDELQRKVTHLETALDDKDAEIIRLKRKAGEL